MNAQVCCLNYDFIIGKAPCESCAHHHVGASILWAQLHVLWGAPCRAVKVKAARVNPSGTVPVPMMYP